MNDKLCIKNIYHCHKNTNYRVDSQEQPIDFWSTIHDNWTHWQKMSLSFCLGIDPMQKKCLSCYVLKWFYHRGWCPKFAPGLNIKIDIVQKVCPFAKIILAKGQFDHSYTFWTMSYLIFSPGANCGHHPLGDANKLNFFKCLLTTLTMYCL